jgi:hypothetical protein
LTGVGLELVSTTRRRCGPFHVSLVWEVVGVLIILSMPAKETRAVHLHGTTILLTIREQRAFEQAERKIPRGLKSFLEVGLARKGIRDRRLYRQEYDTVEEYCVKRGDFSRPRAYELCAASEIG